MNRTFVKILAVATGALGLVACNQKAEYTTESFVAFSASSINIMEDAGTVTIPVYAYTKAGDYAFPRDTTGKTNTIITFEVIEGSAKQGTDFTVEPSSGVISLNGISQGGITVSVTNHEGRNDDLDFTIRLVGATEGYTLGGLRELNVKIVDSDNPLSKIVGTYEAKGLKDALGGTSYDVSITLASVAGRDNMVTISGFNPAIESGNPSPVSGSVSIEGEDPQYITIYSKQKLMDYNGQQVDFYCIDGFSGGYIYPASVLTLTVNLQDQTLTASTGWGAMAETEEGLSVYQMFTDHNVVFHKQ